MSRNPSPRTSAVAFRPRIKVWLECGQDYAFGWGICEILQAVDRAGSIKQGAAALGKSYRYVWSRIKEAEEVLGETLVHAQVGGKGVQRSALTPLARRLVDAFSGYRRHMIAVAEREFARRFGRLKAER